MARPHGSRNKISEGIREKVSELLTKNLERIEQDIEGLSPFQRMRILLELMAYCLPRYAPIGHPVDEMTDDEIDAIIQKLRNDQ